MDDEGSFGGFGTPSPQQEDKPKDVKVEKPKRKVPQAKVVKVPVAQRTCRVRLDGGYVDMEKGKPVHGLSEQESEKLRRYGFIK